MFTLGIIPARGGSKGVKNKNIKLLAGKPLIAYTIEAAFSSRLNAVIVSTDSNEIASIAKQNGGNVPFLRPKQLATDRAKAIPVIQHALMEFESKNSIKVDAVMMLQPTTPFRRPEDINQAISLLETSNADSVISVNNVEGHHPARMKYLDGKGVLIDPPFCEMYENQPRQELKPMYLRNGAIYLTKSETIKLGSFKGKKCMALVMPQQLSVNIDTQFDFDFAEWIYRTYLKTSN